SDLYPTILDVMGVESSHYNGSKSLFERIKTHECDALYIESLYNNYKGVINCLGHKFMHQYSDYGQTISFESVHNPQVFDLKSDSNEEANIYGAADQTQLINQYNDIILNSDVLSEKFRVNDSNYSSEMQDRLRDLGYIA
ncbi:MAG: hypothetical protein KKD39_04310, partial [Candidatus Altiarchaeota archaeon]|nr:hypothetical protein [Candidatus Altiarchaeota archaeon]